MSSGDRQPSEEEDDSVDDERESMADETTAEARDAGITTEETGAGEDGAEEDGTGAVDPREDDPGEIDVGEDGTGVDDNDVPVWRKVWEAESGPLLFLKDGIVSILIVTLIGIGLFAISGVWPPMVAVESDSMEPNINQYDLILVTEAGRFAPESANEQGLVMAQETADHSSFGHAGSVIVFDYPGRTGSPIIHRTQFAVEEGENWFERADPDSIAASDCGELMNCPAPHDGYITQGDNNGQYDQASGIAPVVKPGWVTGVAHIRIPYLGWLRLSLVGSASGGITIPVVETAAIADSLPLIGATPTAMVESTPTTLAGTTSTAMVESTPTAATAG